MRPGKRLTAREAAEDICYLINELGCSVRIKTKFDCYIYPLSYKMSKSGTTIIPGRSDIIQSNKVEPWFICKGEIVVSFNSCFPYIEIQDVYGRWHGNFIDIYHDKGNTPTFDVMIRWGEDLNILMLYKKPSIVQPGYLYSYRDSIEGLDRLGVVTHITLDDSKEDHLIIHTLGSDKVEDSMEEHSYSKNTEHIDSENYFVLLKHNNTHIEL